MDYFDSPVPNYDIREHDQSLNELNAVLELSLVPNDETLKVEPPKCKSSKLKKQAKIRTGRNAQKIYHNILRRWLQNQNCSLILAKYNKFFNQRVYFVLVLDEINKHIDGNQFIQIYKDMASNVIESKMNQAETFDKIKSQNQQSQHLSRVVEEIKYSIKAAQQFVQGNVYDALVTVYQRDQKKIGKMSQFKKAIDIFTDVTGYYPVNYN